MAAPHHAHRCRRCGAEFPCPLPGLCIRPARPNVCPECVDTASAGLVAPLDRDVLRFAGAEIERVARCVRWDVLSTSATRQELRAAIQGTTVVAD